MLNQVKSIVGHPANQNGRLRALLRALRWQIHKRTSSKPYYINYHGFQLRCSPDNHSVSRAIYYSGLPDFEEMQFIVDYLRPEDVFLDAGANIGLYTLLALSRVGKSGWVHAFEPNSEVATVLGESLTLNGLSNVTLHQIGLADVAGEIGFDTTDDDCTAHINVQDSSASGDQIKIDRLDNLLENIPYAMAKFDLEGYEPFAIRGASRWMESQNPAVMLIEMDGFSKRYGVTTPQFIDELDQFGYFVATYDPIKRELLPTTRPWEIPVQNVLAISKAKRDFVQQRIEETSPKSV